MVYFCLRRRCYFGYWHYQISELDKRDNLTLCFLVKQSTVQLIYLESLAFIFWEEAHCYTDFRDGMFHFASHTHTRTHGVNAISKITDAIVAYGRLTAQG